MPTAIQAQLIEGPGGGLLMQIDPRHVHDQAWSNGRNIRFPTGGSKIRKTDGYTAWKQVVPAEPIRALWEFVDPLQNRQLISITTTRVIRGVESQAENITAPGVPDCTLDDVVTIDQYKNELYWADGKTPVMRYVGTGTAAPAIAGGFPNGKLVEVHKSRLLLGNITAVKPGETIIQPWRVQFSKTGTPQDFDDVAEGTAGLIDFTEDNTPVVALKVLGDHVIVHKPSRLYRMIAVGVPLNYNTEQIPGDDGAISARSPISVGSYQYYMGRSNFYRLASFTEPIGDAIWPEILRSADWTKAHRIYAYRRQEFDEVAWKIPQQGGAPELGGAPDLSAVYNVRDQTWTLTDHDPGTCYTELPQVPWFTPLAVPHLPPVVGVFGQVGGTLQAYDTVNANGQAIHAWVESKHFQAGTIPVKLLAVACYAIGTGSISIRCRAAMDQRQPMPAWDATHAHLMVLDPSQTRPWVDCREYGRLWQVRIESHALNDDWEISAYGPAVIPGGHVR
jgi:hypothetical protein